MRIGVVGLGRMGGNIARRLMKHGHRPVVHDVDAAAIGALEQEGASAAATIEAMVKQLERPRVVWLMLPAGEVTERALGDVASQLATNDVLIDGGNAFWKDDLHRAVVLKSRGIHYLDVGTSGGIHGLERGYCLMVGGEKAIVQRVEPFFRALAQPGGYVHAGPTGAGHFAKMVHNAIEYGLMQAYAEGFEILRHAEQYDFDIGAIAETWRHGSVVTSWLLDLAAQALAQDKELATYAGVVGDSGEGRWALMAAIEERVPADVLAAALHARFRSQASESFANKMLSALRAGFGGHVEVRGRTPNSDGGGRTPNSIT
ncbi:MAG: phosphogluconate dehydrogenase (NAD(+)-dependent, decarboxylating) [Bacillota bacterium]